jgi:hypothetical protein
MKVICEFNICVAGHSSRAVKGMNCLRPLEHWNRRFEFHLKHGCLSVFVLFVFCVGSGIATG